MSDDADDDGDSSLSADARGRRRRRARVVAVVAVVVDDCTARPDAPRAAPARAHRGDARATVETIVIARVDRRRTRPRSRRRASTVDEWDRVEKWIAWWIRLIRRER